jgi:hypothetical protein
MRRDEPEVRSCYRKNVAQEDFLRRVNGILEPHEGQWELPGEQAHPTVHIIGPPRSGTTFVNQLICHHLDIGYINHLIAAFWEAPIHGVLLARKLLGPTYASQFTSEFGRTHDIHEPHEFGYFWSGHLRYPDMRQRDESHGRQIDWTRLADVLQRMTRAFERPIVFKPFLLIWHLQEFQRVLANSLFIRIHRDPVDNAVSLLQSREKFLGSADKWLSLRPLACADVDNQPPWYQVASQVFHLNRWLDLQISHLIPGSVLNLDYADVCRDPVAATAAVQRFLQSHGLQLGSRQPVSASCARPSRAGMQHPQSRAIAEQFDHWQQAAYHSNPMAEAA